MKLTGQSAGHRRKTIPHNFVAEQSQSFKSPPFRSSVILKNHFARVHIYMCAALGLVLAADARTASAITADDVMKKMSQEHRYGYLTGLIDMLAYQTAAAGNRAKGDCIIDAFFRKKTEDSWKRLHDVLEKFSDKRPEILLTVLADQLCKS